MNKNKLLYGVFCLCFSLLFAEEDAPTADKLVSVVTHNGCAVKEWIVSSPSDSSHSDLSQGDLSQSASQSASMKTILSAEAETSAEGLMVKVSGRKSINKCKDVATMIESNHYSAAGYSVIVTLFQGVTMAVLDIKREQFTIKADIFRDKDCSPVFSKKIDPLDLSKCSVVVSKNSDGRDMLVVKVPYLKEKLNNILRQDIPVIYEFEK